MATFVMVGLAVLAAGASSWKWLRVAQREHYESGRCVRIALLWCNARPPNWGLLFVSVLGGVAAFVVGGALGVALATVGIVAALVWPYRLATFPKERPFAFTPRARRLTFGYVLLAGGVGTAVGIVQPLALPLWVLAIPLMVDVAAGLMRPIESRMGEVYIVQARAKLDDISPQVIAITGSYGKTSTKVALAALLEGTKRTLVSPASFNNLQGLSRTVNDRLVPGVQVLVAEMGTYGPGEIRALCEVFRPQIVAITTIGEAHLERMKDRATIVRAKSEITEGAEVVVLNVEVPELASLADRLSSTKRIIRCATKQLPGVDVVVDPDAGRLFIREGFDGPLSLPEDAHAINVAIAVGLAVAAGVTAEHVAARVAGIRVPEHRAEVTARKDGLVVIDDTYNSNPTGAEKALNLALARRGRDGRVFVITPGMVELGDQQYARNRDFAESIPVDSGQLVVVGWTNRRALLDGAAETGLDTVTAASRDQAAIAVGREASEGDVILFENDLPDHYP